MEPEKPPKRTNATVLLRLTPKRPPKKICKIVGYSTGGFAVSIPYHRERAGFIFQMDVDYRKREQEIPQGRCRAFSTTKRIKLSVHPSGVVHFSGEVPQTVVSGAKGVGVQIDPLDRPIRTGPTANVVCWGLHDFDDLERAPRPRDIIFELSDVYQKSKGRAYVFDIWVFTRPELEEAAVRNGRKVMLQPMSLDGKERECELVVSELADPKIFLGIMCRCMPLMNIEAVSGYQINGPCERKGRRDPIGKNSLHAIFPMPPQNRIPTKSLDYRPDDP